MKIIGYTYEAAAHCVACTQRCADVGLLQRRPPLRLETDEQGIALDLVDREGNAVHPIFSTDETDTAGLYCDECRAAIAAPLRDYRVKVRWQGERLIFPCRAEDDSHAREQAANAYPDSVIMAVNLGPSRGGE